MTHYSLQLLTSTSFCDKLLKIIDRRHRNLLKKKLMLELQVEAFLSESQHITESLADTRVQLTVLDNVLAAPLPDSAARDEYTMNRKRLEYEAFELENRQARCNAVDLLEKELLLQSVKAELETTEVFIEIIETHKDSFRNILGTGEQV